MAESLDVSGALCAVGLAVRGAWGDAEHRLPAPLLQVRPPVPPLKALGYQDLLGFGIHLMYTS